MTDTLKPDPHALAAELAALSRKGVTSDGLRQCPAVLSLSLVAAKSASGDDADLAVGASIVIREAAVSVDLSNTGPAGVLLAVAPGMRGTLLKSRRLEAAQLMHVSPEHFRKEREELLLEAVADEIYAADSAYRLRHKHRTEPERQPEDSRLRIDWLAQHRSYRRIWTPVWAMKADLQVLVSYIEQNHQDEANIADRLCNLTWRYAQFLRELEHFIEEQGGLWLLADAQAEISAADAIYRIDNLAPLGEMDCSWLRQLLADAKDQELEPFTDALIAAGERRRELLAVWMDWASTCDCREGETEPRCLRHRWEAAAEEFIRLIDEDWYRVADWYRTAPPSETSQQRQLSHH